MKNYPFFIRKGNGLSILCIVIWFQVSVRFSFCKCTHFFLSVERDAQLLANRIALLKQEEMKTWKKIEETKKRAGEVMRLKQRNNERIQEKMEKMQYE